MPKEPRKAPRKKSPEDWRRAFRDWRCSREARETRFRGEKLGRTLFNKLLDFRTGELVTHSHD